MSVSVLRLGLDQALDRVESIRVMEGRPGAVTRTTTLEPRAMAVTRSSSTLRECVPENAMSDADEIARFYDRCSDLMRELLDGLAAAPDRPRPFPEIEDAIGWPRRRIASVLGGVCRLRQMEFNGRRPYHFHDPRNAASRRWEIWMDGAQARVVLAEQRM
jgi:hypothetical protein